MTSEKLPGSVDWEAGGRREEVSTGGVYVFHKVEVWKNEDES